MTTANLGLPELVHRERNGEVTHNTALQSLDIYAQPRVEDILVAQPVSPAEGQIWIVGASATGADWSGQDNNLAHYYDSVWHFYVPNVSMRFLNKGDNHFYVWAGASWAKVLNLPCYGQAELLPPAAPAQALGAAVTVGIHGYSVSSVPPRNMGVTLAPAGAANSAVFAPSTDYYGLFSCDIVLEFTAPSSGIFQFFVWDGTKDTLIGTRNLTADTLTVGSFSGSIQLVVATSITMEFRVQCDTAQSIVYNSLSAKAERLDV